MKIKIFCGDDNDRLEDKINKWLGEDYRIFTIKQTECMSDESGGIISWITISIWYFDKPKEDPRD